jgi:prepilin-type processing-associated H-X9-DG protein
MSKTTIPSGGITDGTLTSAKLDQDGAFTFNEDSADVNFRVESNGNANMLFVDGGNDFVGIGAVPTQAKLHIITNDSGALNDSNSDDFMIENTSATGMTIGSSNDGEGHIHFSDSDDADVGTISYFHGSNYMRMRVNASERMRINSNGTISIGNTGSAASSFSDTGDVGVYLSPTSSTGASTFAMSGDQPLTINRSDDNNNNSTLVGLRRRNEICGTIKGTNNTAQYNTSSDYRLKENVNYSWDATTRLKQLKPARFNWISDETNTAVDGFIAHEVTPVVPQATSGEKDAMAVETRYTSDDVETQGDNPSKNVGDPKTYSTTEIDVQGIDHSKLVPILTKALQEAITEIESLKARVTTLEG